jgi:hypothetical protein
MGLAGCTVTPSETISLMAIRPGRGTGDDGLVSLGSRAFKRWCRREIPGSRWRATLHGGGDVIDFFTPAYRRPRHAG